MTGHDENITVTRMSEIVGADVARDLERLTRGVYGRGREVAERRGILIADTKFEFGRDASGRILLIDEVLTPDSSRFWPADGYQPGFRSRASDKLLSRLSRREKNAGLLDCEEPPPSPCRGGRARDDERYPARTPGSPTPR